MTDLLLLSDITCGEGDRLGGGSVSVNLLPRHEPVEMSRRAARQLFRLLQAYNWAVESEKTYRTRWMLFWPTISLVERKLLVLLLMTHGVDSVGRPVKIVNPPVDFEADEGKPHWGRIHPVIAAEFRNVLTTHYLRLVTPAQITAWWHARPGTLAEAVALLEDAQLLDRVLDPVLGFQPDLVERAIVDALVQVGVDKDKACGTATLLSGELDLLLVQEEGKFWNDIASS